MPGAGASRRLPAAGAAQEERERVTLLAGQRRSGVDQPGDIGVQAGLSVIFGRPIVVGAFVLLAACGRGRAGPGWSRTGSLEARPVPHSRSPLSRRCWSPGMI
jgi:hypothetical protein